MIESQYGLLNAVQRPQTTVFGKDAYPTFADKAAAFLFALMQNMPFRASNKRLALAALVAFCEINNRTINPKALDEKGVENIVKRASSVRDQSVPPEQIFRELREQLAKAIV